MQALLRRRTQPTGYRRTVLKKHKGHVKEISIDIGADDLAACVDRSVNKDLVDRVMRHGRIHSACIDRGLASVQRNMSTITKALRKDAPGVKIIGGTYYD